MTTAGKDFLTTCLFFITITAFSLTIRILYLFHTDFIEPIRGDAAYYLVYARNLLEYGIFSRDYDNIPPVPDSYWAPGYPAWLAMILKITSTLKIDYYAPALYAQAILGASLSGMTYLLGALFMRKGWAIFAALLVAISPHLISIGGYLLTETLCAFSLLLSIYLFCLALTRKNHWYLTISGLVFGSCYLINPVVFFLPIGLFFLTYFLPDYLMLGGKRNHRIYATVFILLFLTIAGIWSTRNALVVTENASTSSNRLLDNVIVGSHSNYYEIWRNNPRDPNNPASIDTQEVKGDIGLFLQTLARRIFENPSHYAKWYFFTKPLLLWGWDIQIGQGDIYVYPVLSSLYHKSKIALASYSLMRASHFWLFGFALLGLLYLIRIKQEENLTILIILYMTLIYISTVYVITQAEPRYSIPLRPEMYLCAAFCIHRLHCLIEQKRQGTQTSEALA